MDPQIATSQWRETQFSRGVEDKMKYLHVFGDNDRLGALLVTTDDEVYGVGYCGIWGLLGFLEPNILHCVGEVQVHRLSHQRVICIAVGGTVGAATTADGRIFHWGRDLRDLNKGVDCVVTGVHQPDGPLRHFVHVACGYSFVAALTDQGQVILWGLIADRAAAVYSYLISTPHVISLSCGMYHIAMLSDFGAVFTCGLGSDGQLGRRWDRGERYLKDRPVHLGHNVIQVACGTRSTLFLMDDGSLLATGTSNGLYGHLGVDIDEADDSIARSPERVVIYVPVERIAATIFPPSIYAAVTEKGNVFTWGQRKLPVIMMGQSKLISAFYRAAIPTLLGDVFRPLEDASRNTAAGRPNAQKTRPDLRIINLSPNNLRRYENNANRSRKSLELGSIMSDLTTLYDEVGNLIGKLAPLLDRENTSNPRASTNEKKYN